jgi:hypothetical protein
MSASRLAIRPGERDLKRERFDGDDLVVLGRGAGRIANRAVQDDRVLFAPQELDDLLHLVLLAEERPPQEFELSLGRLNGTLFEREDRVALGNENVLAWVEEIFGMLDPLNFKGGGVHCFNCKAIAEKRYCA